MQKNLPVRTFLPFAGTGFCLSSLYPLSLSVKYTTSYWIEILEFSELVGLVPGVQRDVSGHLIRPGGLPVTADIDAKINDAGNEICLTLREVKALRLYLDEELIDMERPLRVSVNNKEVYVGKIESNLPSMLDTVKKRNDRNILYSAHPDVKVPAGF